MDRTGADSVLNFSSGYGGNLTLINYQSKTANTNTQTVSLNYTASSKEKLVFVEDSNVLLGTVTANPKINNTVYTTRIFDSLCKIYLIPVVSGDKFSYSVSFSSASSSAGNRKIVTAILMKIT